MIALHDFSVGYANRRLLSGVNAVIPDGQLTALIGRNGSGKSTLLRTLAGINARYSGDVLLNGRIARDLSPHNMAKTVAFVSTERIRIPNLRCRDVVAIGRAPFTDWMGRLKPADLEVVDKALSDVGMLDFAEVSLDRLSDGEAQRVMIARALAQSTPIVLLDEPTSFLDLPNRFELCALLADLAHAEGKCILFSTHELNIALQLCDSVALIDDASLFCLPAPEMRGSGLVERMFSAGGSSLDAATVSMFLGAGQQPG